MKTQNRKFLPLALASAALGLSLLPIQQVRAAGFVSASPMNIARNFHTATLLPNGKVLVAGGAQSQSATSAELYDPASNTWAATGSLLVGRSHHTAMLLHNRKVLVVGGPLSTSTELYDPDTGTWTLTGRMTRARSQPTATLLPNGKVFVAGGIPGDQPDYRSSELYDPISGTWTATGSASSSHRTATLLPNGKVLGSGGEIYDPTTGTWMATGAPSGFGYYTATLLLNGKVLVAGGRRIPTAELYDCDTGTWSDTGSLAWDRDFCTATLLRNGQVLVAGGLWQVQLHIAIPSAELYDSTTGTWTEMPMNSGRFSHTATLLANGKVLVAGGLDTISPGGGVRPLSSAELYEPDTDGAIPSLTILYNANQVLSFSWSGVGTLEQSDSLTTPNWQPAPIQDDPQIINTTSATKFYRVKAESSVTAQDFSGITHD